MFTCLTSVMADHPGGKQQGHSPQRMSYIVCNNCPHRKLHGAAAPRTGGALRVLWAKFGRWLGVQ
ncbi:hypothetical protein HC928_23330 [bacterium]|nr:hypothetical protein [bacterium]